MKNIPGDKPHSRVKKKKKDEMRGNHTHKKYIVLRENSGKRNMTHL